MPSWWIRIMLLVVSLVALVALVACGGGGDGDAAGGDVAGGPPKEQPAPVDDPVGGGQADEPEDGAAGRDVIEGPTLQQYLDADTLHGSFTMTTTYEQQEDVLEHTGEVWLTADRFRFDLYEDGVYVRSLQTPDGELAYVVNEEDKRSSPSNSTVEGYIRRWRPPPVDAVEDGVDPETGSRRLRYPVQDTFPLEGTPNPWYQEDLVVLLEGDRVVGLISTGWALLDDGGRGQISANRMVFSSLQAQEEIDPAVFELPYPVG